MTGTVAEWLKALAGATVPSSIVARLRLAFLLPLAGAMAILIVIWVAALYAHERIEIRRDVERVQASIGKIYRNNVASHARLLEVAMEAIRRDAALRAAFAQQDRNALLRVATPISATLQSKFGITQFYFSSPGRVSLLRLHQPDRYGEVVDRYTMLEAERTGAASYGMELGQIGTFTLRMATPWYETDAKSRLIGYVELGIDVDQILGRVRTIAGLPLFVLISKEYIERGGWEAGMRMLGRTPEWERFPNAVLSIQTPEAIPAELASWLARGLSAGVTVMEPTSMGVVSVPLTDAAGREVGRLVAYADVAARLASMRRVIYVGVGVGVLIAGVLLGFFYGLAGRIGRRMECDEEALQRLAACDGLTGLYNHRTFYALLDAELARARRFHRPVSLLMLDIDHFKRVNDTHGHLAGDAILKGLSELLGRQARAIDRVCRYGGEEITVILPEIDLETAANAAERLRAAVEAQSFDAEGTPVRITVSVGVASFPAHADNAQALVAAADAALYAAKQGGRNRIILYEPPLGQPAAQD